jgi:hypothetical protein
MRKNESLINIIEKILTPETNWELIMSVIEQIKKEGTSNILITTNKEEVVTDIKIWLESYKKLF